MFCYIAVHMSDSCKSNDYHYRPYLIKVCTIYFPPQPINVAVIAFKLSYRYYKNSAEVDIAPACGEITTACNLGQAKNGSCCVLEGCVKEDHYAKFHTQSHLLLQTNALNFWTRQKIWKKSVEREM